MLSLCLLACLSVRAIRPSAPMLSMPRRPYVATCAVPSAATVGGVHVGEQGGILGLKCVVVARERRGLAGDLFQGEFPRPDRDTRRAVAHLRRMS